MKKISILLFIFYVTAGYFSPSAKAQAFNRGDNLLGIGIGLGSSLGGFTYGSQSPALSVQYEHGNWDVGGPGVISLGGYLGYKSFSYDASPYSYYTYSEKWTYIILG